MFIPALDISVYHLIFLSNSITHSWQSFEKITCKSSDGNKASIAELSVFENIISLILIRTNSLLDEYNQQFTMLNNNKIFQIAFITQPIWNRINQWTEISLFRHNVLAHNLRQQRRENYKSIFFVKPLTDFDIPKTLNEVIVLVECIKLFKQLLLFAFNTEYQNALSYLESIHHNSITKNCDVQSELQKVHAELREQEKLWRDQHCH